MNQKIDLKIIWGIFIAGILASGTVLFLKHEPEIYFSLHKDKKIPGMVIEGIEFPKDESAHRDLPVEWWYFKAHLVGEDSPQDVFGLVALFFKDGRLPLIFIVDGKNQKKYLVTEGSAVEILSEDKLLLKSGKNYWIETGLFKYRIYYQNKNIKIDLTLDSLKNPMIIDTSSIHIYRVLSRMDVRGEIGFGGQKYRVSGGGWIDHEAVRREILSFVSGWKWFAIQLDNNVELMLNEIEFTTKEDNFYRYFYIYEKDSSGTNFKKIESGDYALEELDFWDSSQSNRRYPISWNLSVPSENINLKIDSLMDDQLVESQFSYEVYEGACKVGGIFRGEETTGWAQFENWIFPQKSK